MTGADGVAAIHVSRGRAQRRSWGADCSRSTDERPVAPLTAAPDALGDDELSALAARGGVAVYVWSPHMPLSVDGVAHARRAAAALGLRFVAVSHARRRRRPGSRPRWRGRSIPSS